jgi:integrase
MKREKNRLSARSVNTVKERGLHNDGFGLNLQVSQFWSVEYTDRGKTRGRSFEKEKLALAHQEELRTRGIEARIKSYVTKSWLFRYLRAGKDRKLGLGSLETTSLARARELAQQARELLRQSIDPIDHAVAERKRKAPAPKRLTFGQGGNEYIEANRAGWRSAKHLHQWTATLNETRKGKRIFPAMTAAINDLDIAAIDTPHVLAILKPIWYSMPETASRLRARIEAVLNYAKAAKERTGDNPARWEALKDLLPAKTKIAKVKHHPALSYADIPAFMGELRAKNGPAARALEFTILTGARIGESLLARWSEVDFEAKTWTVPPDRMKAGKEHVVPLSDRALAILEAMPRQGELIFPGQRGKLSDQSLRNVLAKLRPDVTPHGFRSSLRDWAGDETNFPREVVEHALAHKIGNTTEQAYRRASALEKRRKLMQAWTNHCARSPAVAEVIQLRAST